MLGVNIKMLTKMCIRDRGHYLDVIARGSKLANDFKLVDLSGNAAKADYDTWAYGISAEYGYRQNLNSGWFVEPQAELSLGHINGTDYTMSNGGRIENDSVNSAVVRLGFLGGKEFTIGGRTSNTYVKAVSYTHLAVYKRQIINTLR